MQVTGGNQAQEAAFPVMLAKAKEMNWSLKRQVAEMREETSQLSPDLAQKQQAFIETAPQPPAPASSTQPVSSDPTALGTITTILGQTYQDCHVLKIESNDIVVNCSTGILQIPYANMPSDLQKRFGYDPQKAAQTDDAKIRFQDQIRQTGGQ
jgi:hypothetical protein